MLNSEIFGARVLRGAFFAADESGNGGGGEAPAGAGGADEANAWRRRHDAKERELRAVASELDGLRREREGREAQGMSEAQKAARRAEEAEARASQAERNLMARDIAAEMGLPYGASKFIGGQSEEEMRASAGELKGLGVGDPIRPSGTFPTLRPSGTSPKGEEIAYSAAIGSASAPARAVELPVDDQIAAAYKSGNQAEAIRLKRMKAGLGVGSQQG